MGEATPPLFILFPLSSRPFLAYPSTYSLLAVTVVLVDMGILKLLDHVFSDDCSTFHILLSPISRGSHKISRSTLAYFHSAGFEEPRDTRGNPLPSAVEGVGPGESAAVLEQDPLRTGPFQVSVQLLAFSV